MVIENQKKYGNQKRFYINLHLTRGLGMKYTACYGELMPEGVLTLFTIIM